jgi:hypothetical protein
MASQPPSSASGGPPDSFLSAVKRNVVAVALALNQFLTGFGPVSAKPVQSCPLARGAKPTAAAGKSGKTSGSGMNVDDALKTLNKNAWPKYEKGHTGNCATYVRMALEDGGIKGPHPSPAKEYGPHLEKHGFTPIPPEEMKTYEPKRGDVVVIQNYEGGRPEGHIAMYNGEQWVSDFKQPGGADIWGVSSHYRAAQPSYKIYRP